jgi:glycosyltransferase involved in cell wall biosynthesis
MRLALLHYSAPPIVGGVESVLAHHARLMADAGHAVRVIAARGEQWDARVALLRLPLADSRHPEVLAVKSALDIGSVPSGFAHLRDDLQRELRALSSDVDVLIAHNVCSLHKNLALTAALQGLNGASGFPHLVLWHHDLAWTTPRYRAELHDGYPWDLLRNAAAWPGVTQAAVSELRRRELAQLLSLPEESIRVVPNGVDRAAFFKLEPQTMALIDQMSLMGAAPLLLLPVRLTPRKNIELALRALAELRRDFPQAMLLVTGPEGPHNPANAEYRRKLLELRDDLNLRGAAHFVAEYTAEFLPDAVVADFFRLADALIFPSREEGFGIPIIEAGFSRLPIFCADIPPLRELGGDEAVYFSPEADPADVAGLMSARFRRDPIYHLAARARDAYTWEGVYARHIAPLLSGLNVPGG